MNKMITALIVLCLSAAVIVGVSGTLSFCECDLNTRVAVYSVKQ